MASKKKANPVKEVRESAHKIWLAGLGALSMAEGEGTKMFKKLVKEGEGFEKRGKSKIQKVQDSVEDSFEGARDKAETTLGKLGASFDERVASALNNLGVPSRHEIQRLTKRVEELTEKVDALNKKPARAASKAKSKAKAKTKAKTKSTTSRTRTVKA